MVMAPGEDAGESRIAQERTGPGTAPPYFWAVVGLFAFASAVLALQAGRTTAFTPAEQEGQGFRDILGAIPLETGRAVAGASVAVMVVATGIAGRRLFHSSGAGLVAAALVALDPLVLVSGRLALPAAPAAALAMAALALFTYARDAAHWTAAVLLGCAAVVDARLLFWGPPAALLLLFRGHIYAAPQHLARSLSQAVLVPILFGVGAIALGARPGEGCLEAPLGESLLLMVAPQTGDNAVLLANPATWFAGLGGLAFLGATAIGMAATHFRVARLPGRIQFRLDSGSHGLLTRSLWLLLFALFTPIPLLLLPLFAITLGAGVRELADDAPGFGLAVGAVLVVLALLVFARAWGVVSGTGGAAEVQEFLDIVPWVEARAC